ncbi:methyltransferase domain-containing protein [Rhodocytophaga aerolata]|uniref:Methyltransferase domain-containing protein n=1 Tax=Rhodocytophaga aerolata TaxID=455078 RepID=A0ABT8RGZ2_9BACT|nr:methyltransferase domain-containing protein [Rhodocytophaga aerolata]MDO1450971.1 methyltransferase domain-containing protein [Rhodocytophaga aerolata]
MANKGITDQELAAQLRKPTGELGKLVAEKMSQNNAFLYQQAFQLMDIQPTDRVLEIGFGHGQFLAQTVELASDGWVAGVDFSEDMILAASYRYATLIEAGKLAIVQGDITAIPYADNTFTKVFALNTIYFIDDPLGALQELYRVLRTGGMGCIGIRTASTMKNHAFTQYGFTCYELPQVEELFLQAGFKAIQHKHQSDEVSPEFDALTVIGFK